MAKSKVSNRYLVSGDGSKNNLLRAALVASRMLAWLAILLVEKTITAVQELCTIIVGIVAQGSEHGISENICVTGQWE